MTGVALDVGQLADLASVDCRPHFFDRRKVAMIETDGQHLAGCLGRRNHLVAGRDAVRHRLFHNHVFAGVHRRRGQFGMGVGRRADNDGIDISRADQFVAGRKDASRPRKCRRTRRVDIEHPGKCSVPHAIDSHFAKLGDGARTDNCKSHEKS